MSTSEGTDLYFEYCTQERRTYVEVLVDFESVDIPLAYLVELIPPLQPRYVATWPTYLPAISSSRISDDNPTDPGELHVLVTHRSFSIASAPPAHLETSTGGNSGDADVEVDICAAVVSYKTKFGRRKKVRSALPTPRQSPDAWLWCVWSCVQGVCSSWLQGLQTGDVVPVWICPGTMRLPLVPAPDVCPPTVLIGPGTTCSSSLPVSAS